MLVFPEYALSFMSSIALLPAILCLQMCVQLLQALPLQLPAAGTFMPISPGFIFLRGVRPMFFVPDYLCKPHNWCFASSGSSTLVCGRTVGSDRVSRAHWRGPSDELLDNRFLWLQLHVGVPVEV